MIKIDEKKYRVGIDCGLSAYSYIKAEEWIRDQIDPDCKQKLYFELSVPSQQMSDAVNLAFCLNVTSVKINFDYREDEWSVTGYYYDKDFHKTELTAWSPGA